MLGLFGRTFLIGVAVAAPVGAMGLLCIDRTLKRGWTAGMITGLGIATADGLYGAVAAFGVTAVSSVLIEWQAPLRLAGGAALIVMGVRSMLARPASDAECDVTVEEGGRASLYASSVALTLANPMTIIAFGAIFMGAGVGVAGGAAEALVATAGITLGSLAWWSVLVAGTAFVRHGVGGGLRVWLGRFSGALVACFGVYALVSAFGLT